MRSVRSTVGVLLSVAVLVAGCGGSKGASTGKSSAGKTPAASQTAKAPEPKLETVNVKMAIGGDKTSFIFLTPVLAKFGGYFDQQAINLDLQELQGGAQAAQAVATGQVDFATMAVEHAVKAKANGVDLVTVALFTRYPTVTLIVDSKYKGKVKTPADLKGMKIGITSPGSGSHKALLSILDKFGLKPSDVEIIGVGTTGMKDAMESGKIQAAANYDPQISLLTSSGKAYVLYDLRTKKDTEALYGGEYPYVGLVTRKEIVDKNPELVQRVVKATIAANQFLIKEGAATVADKLPAEIKGKDEALYVTALNANLEAFSPDSIATDAGLQTVIASLKKDGAIPDSANITPSTIFDAKFARNAMK